MNNYLSAKEVKDRYKITSQSQIHQIEELKRNTEPDIWNTITFVEMLSMDGSLFGIDKSLDFKERKLWHKILLRRMSREKLLGKKMR